MPLLLILALTAALSVLAGVFLSRANKGLALPWDRRPRRFSLGWLAFFLGSAVVGLTWTGLHFGQWGVFGMVTALLAWMGPWLAIQARHNSQMVSQHAH